MNDGDALDVVLEEFTRDFARRHWREGEGRTVEVDMLSFLTERPGRILSSIIQYSNPIGEVVYGLPSGSIVQFETNAADRSRGGFYGAGRAHSFYISDGLLSENAYVWGHASAGFDGTVEVLRNGNLHIEGYIKAYDDQFDFNRNTLNPFLEFPRWVAGRLAGPGEGYEIRYDGEGVRVDGEYSLQELRRGRGFRLRPAGASNIGGAPFSTSGGSSGYRPSAAQRSRALSRAASESSRF
jgi:hypothetical protein